MCKRSVLAVVLVALLALAGACSSASTDQTLEAGEGAVDGDGASTAAVPGVLAFGEVLTGTASADSARFQGDYTVTGIDEDDPASVVELMIEGSFEESTESLEVTIDLGDYFASGLAGEEAVMLAGFEGYLSDPVHLVVIGSEGWISWSLLSMLSGQPDAWLALEEDGSGATSDSFGFANQISNPTELLAALAAADAEVEDLGSETVRGVQTRHWRALIDLESLSAGLDPIEQAALEEKVGPLSSAEFPMDLWVGDDGLLRRYAIEMSAEGLASGDPAPVGSVEVVVEVFDYGADVGITAPSPDQVISGANLFAL